MANGATFNWVPSFTTNKSHTPKVRGAKFGEGYEARMRDGINSNPKTWGIVFTNISDSDAAAIYAFLKGTDGVDYFIFNDPDGEARHYTCKDPKQTFDAYNGNTVTATFVECFDP